jgi:hypothetical protein
VLAEEELVDVEKASAIIFTQVKKYTQIKHELCQSIKMLFFSN